MTNELAVRTSNLVLPTTGYEIDREEMCYIDGGAFIGLNLSASQVNSMFNALDITLTVIDIVGISTVATMMAGPLTAVCSWINALPVLGQVAFFAVAAAAVTLAGALTTAFIMGKGFQIGVDVSVSWFKLNATLKCGFI